MVSKYSKHPSIAADLVRYLCSAETQKRRALELCLLPTRPELYADQQILANTPWFANMRTVLDDSVVRPSTVLKGKYFEISTAVFQNVNKVLSRAESATDAVGQIEQTTPFQAMSEWHLGEISSCHANMDEAISLAKELNDTNAIALALGFASYLAHYERNPTEVERLASNSIELSTRQNFAFFLAGGELLRGWTRSASGDTAESLALIEHGIGDTRATGTVLVLPYYLALKAEVLYLAQCTSEALEAINEAEALAESYEVRWWRAELHRLRAVLLTAIGVEEAQIEASFCEAIKTAREQKSISLETRAEATYAEYRRQRASAPGGSGFRLPL